jgi:CDP-diglyceride synthetase
VSEPRSSRPPSEGVRIIGAEEAQAALEAGEAAGRRPGDQPRFGDVPPPPPGPRPAHRFPLPDSVDPAQAVALPPLAPNRQTEPATPESPEGTAVVASGGQPAAGEGRTAPFSTTGIPARPAPPAPEERAAPWTPSTSSPPPPTLAPHGDPMDPYGAIDRTTEIDPRSTDIPLEGITVSGSAPEMPHWSDPPTGEVPRLRFDDDKAVEDEGDWRSFGAKAVRWRDDAAWDEEDELGDLVADGDEPVGALDSGRSDQSDLYSFDEDFERVAASRSGSHPVLDLTTFEEAGEPADEWAPSARGASARRGAAGHRRWRHAGRAAMDPGSSGAEADETAAVSGAGGRRVSGYGAAAASPGGSGAADVGGGVRTRPRPSRPPTRPGSTVGSRGRAGVASGGGDLGSRVGVGAVLIALLIIASLVGPKALVVLSAAVVVAAAAEAYNMTRAPGFRPATLLGLVATVGCVLGAYWKGIGAIPVVTVLLFAGSMLWYVLGVVEARPLANAAVTVMVFVWVSVLGAFSAVLLGMRHGEGLFIGAVLVAVAADIAAFVVGRWIGVRPMAPNISPNKTIEGYIGGVVGAVIVGLIVGKELTPWGGMKHGLALGLVVGLIAPVGDLFESMLKRDLGLKDSGRALGGHGGLLDRFDALLLALPAAYFVATIARI